MSIAIDPLIRIKLQQFVTRRRRWTIFYALLVGVVVWVVGVLLFTWVDAVWILDRRTRLLLSIAAYAAALLSALVIATRRLRGTDPITHAAVAIERERPELRDHLLSAVELSRADSPAYSSSFIVALQQSVSGKLRGVDVRSLLPLKLLSKPLAIASVAVLGCVLLALVPQLRFGNRFARAIIPGFDIDRVSRTRIVIERPSPASRPVPANEIAAVVVHLEGELSDEATLEWTSEDGSNGEVDMHATDGNSTAATGEPQASFAANLMVHELPVSYRIKAGDGVTRWQQLEPRSRPEVTTFDMQFTPPAYAKLPSTSTTASEGHLKALTGTVVTLRMHFNMPVDRAVMRRINSGQELPLQGQGQEWTIATTVQFDDRYQILATATETGFDNPLSPQYTITAIDDAPPIARWLDQTSDLTSKKARRELVTGFSLLNLTAGFADEMPMESVLQEVAVNGGDWMPQTLDGDLENDQVRRDWSWDLSLLRHNGRELVAGDVIQTRVVAIDRNGSRGESAIKEFIVSDHEFDAGKLARLKAWIELTNDVDQWKETIDHELVRLKVQDPKPPANDRAPEEAAQDDAPQEEPKFEKVIADREARKQLIGGMIDKAAHESEAAQLETIARVMRRVEESTPQAAAAPEDKRRDFRWISSHADATLQMAKAEVAHHLGMVLYDDLLRMSASIQPTVRESDPVDWTSFSRYFEITREQYRSLSQTIRSASEAIPDSTRQHNINLLGWIDQQQQLLADAIAQPDNENVVRQTAKQTADAIVSARYHKLIDSRIASSQMELLKRMQNAIGWTRDAFQKMLPLVDQIKTSTAKSGSSNSDEVREAKEKLATATSELERLRTNLVERLRFEGALHQRRPEADQRYVADTHLLDKVLNRISEASFQPPEGKSMRDVYQEISAAYHLLEAGHETTQWGRELRSLADDDRWNANSAAGRLDAPNRIERFGHGMEFAVAGLKTAGITGAELSAIEGLRWGPTSQAQSAITARRWNTNDIVTAADKLDSIHASFLAATAPLEPPMIKARQTLQSYLPTIAELARKAASTLRESKVKPKPDNPPEEKTEEKAEERAEQKAEKQPEPKPQDEASEPKATTSAEPAPAEEVAAAQAPAEQVATEQASAEQAKQKLAEAMRQVEQLKESLADEANTQELVSEEGRRKARNADISKQAVEKRMEDVQAAADKAKADAATSQADASQQALNESTEKAAQTLEQIAQHYDQEAKEQNEDTTPEAKQGDPLLEALEKELGLAEPLDQQFERSNALADALNSDPRELLKKLQQELQRNPLMQKELDGLTDQTLREAQRALAEQAARERDLQMQLERSDPRLTIAKRELEEAVRRSAEFGQEIDRSLITAATQAADALRNLPEQSNQRAAQVKQELQRATQKLREAINEGFQVGSANEQLMVELQAKADSVQQKLAEASETLRKNNEPVEEILGDEKATLEDKPRLEMKRQMENIQRRARDNQVQMARDQQRRAQQRQQQAEQQMKSAKSRVQREQDSLKKAQDRQQREPDNQNIANEIKRVSGELKKATEFFEAAEAGVEFTKQTTESAKQRAEKVGSKQLPTLDKPLPAAQLAQSMQQLASEQLNEASERMKAAVKSAAESKPIQPATNVVADADQAQQSVANDVADTAEDLRRAARHQQRLGQMELAQNNAAAADAVSRIAEGEVAEASRSLSETKQSMEKAEAESPSSDASAKAQAARDALNRSQAALKAQADKLGQTNQQEPGDQSQGESGEGESPSSSQQAAKESARQMARTLDDLDRSLSASQKSTQEGETPSQSPATLSAAARRQAQKMAMNRSQPSQTQPPPGEAAESSAATESGDGFSKTMADMFDLNQVDRLSDEQWGKLRSREAEEVAEERRVEISPEYRRQIEAYFRVIAEKAKQ